MTTPNRNYPQPTGVNQLRDDVLVLITALSMIDADVQAAFATIAAKAGLVSPAFEGAPTTPTPPIGDDSNQVANTAFVKATTLLALANLVGAAPAALDTVYEIAAKLLEEEGALDALMTVVGNKANAVDVYLKTAIDTMLADMATKTGAETFANKTLTAPVLDAPSITNPLSRAVAEAGTDNSAPLTALRTREAIDYTGIGRGQVWANYLASRSLGVTYTNTTPRPIMVMLEGDVNVNIFVTFSGGLVTELSGNGSSNRGGGSFIVPPGGTYAISGGTITRWLELR